jgi:hypothetical protein
MRPEALRATAAELANSFEIASYIRDSWIYQTGPGERIAIPAGAFAFAGSSYEVVNATEPPIKAAVTISVKMFFSMLSLRFGRPRIAGLERTKA